MTKPFPFQRQGWRAVWKFGGRALIGDEMGLGKSYQSIQYMLRSNSFPTVIVCPAFLKYNWERELAIHANRTGLILEGRKSKKVKAPILIINYDILGDWLHKILAIQPKLLIFDEVHYLKNEETKRWKFAKILSNNTPNVIGLSGTPFINRPIELWAVLQIIKPKLFPNRWQYAMRYCKPKRTPWGWKFDGANNTQELNQILTKKVMIRRLKKDVLKELPEKRHNVVLLDIERRKEYDAAEKDFLRWLYKAKGAATAKKAAAAERLVKWGYLKRLAATLKLKFVKEWIDDILEEKEKLIVFGVHKEFLGTLHKHYSKSSVLITGDTAPSKRLSIVDAFQKKDDTRLLFGNMQAAGVGLNITKRVNTVAIAEMGWTPAEHDQAISRTHRMGQTKDVDAYFLVGKGTIEEDLCEVQQKKQDVFTGVLDGAEASHDFDLFDQLERLMRHGN